MNYLRLVNALLLAAAVTMALVLGVVSLIYAIYADETPRLGRDLPGLLTITGVFVAYAAVTGFALLGLLRERWWRWLGQGAVLMVSAGLSIFVWEFLQ